MGSTLKINNKKYTRQFWDAIKKTLKFEGGYVNHPNDKGGETKYGISKRSFPHVNIQTLTLEKAIDIYFDTYWKNYLFYLIDDNDIRFKIFDMSVLMGHKKAVEILQSTLNKKGTKLKEDGILGDLTANAINQNSHELLQEYKKNLAQHFEFLAKKNPKQKVFLKGWLNRVNG